MALKYNTNNNKKREKNEIATKQNNFVGSLWDCQALGVTFCFSTEWQS